MSRTTATDGVLRGALLLAAGVSASAQSGDKDEKKEPKRPSLTLKATPGTGMVPVRISATAEFKGGDDDFRGVLLPHDRMELGRRNRLGSGERLRSVRSRRLADPPALHRLAQLQARRRVSHLRFA